MDTQSNDNVFQQIFLVEHDDQETDKVSTQISLDSILDSVAKNYIRIEYLLTNHLKDIH